MRSPTQSFKGEVAAFRQRLVKERADYPRLAPALKVLDRWHDRKDAQEIWDTIKEKLPAEAVHPVELIDWVLERWDTATELNERLPKIPDIETKTNHQIKSHSQQKREYRQMAQKAALLADLVEQRERLLGRQGNGHRQFMKSWSDLFQELCGKPLDGIVASLTEIAFDGRVTAHMVRRARRDWPTRPPK